MTPQGMDAEIAALRARVEALEKGTQVFDVVRAERVDIVEPDGRLRLAMANGPRSPDGTIDGVPVAPGRERPGLIFFNDVGDECGGLTFGGGRGESGEVGAGAGLTLDRFRQDQTVAIVYEEEEGRYEAGMRIVDRPEVSLVEVIELAEAAQALPGGPDRDAARKRLREERLFGAPRVFVGRSTGDDALVELSDAAGRPRLRLRVTAQGSASIEFLDAAGEVVQRIGE